MEKANNYPEDTPRPGTGFNDFLSELLTPERIQSAIQTLKEDPNLRSHLIEELTQKYPGGMMEVMRQDDENTPDDLRRQQLLDGIIILGQIKRGWLQEKVTESIFREDEAA